MLQAQFTAVKIKLEETKNSASVRPIPRSSLYPERVSVGHVEMQPADQPPAFSYPFGAAEQRGGAGGSRRAPEGRRPDLRAARRTGAAQGIAPLGATATCPKETPLGCGAAFSFVPFSWRFKRKALAGQRRKPAPQHRTTLT